jgi:transcriptional regulator with XRE-family HTH domain
MSKTSRKSLTIIETQPGSGFRSKGQPALSGSAQSNDQINVGRCLRQLRLEQQLSIRGLAEKSGLNFNTLSLIENGKTSPSVSTLLLLATALDVPITSFFDTGSPKSRIAYQQNHQRTRISFAHGTLEDLGAGLSLHGGQPLLVTLEPQAGSGPTPVVHSGHEFVFCLEGQITYTIDGQVYPLNPGDSLLFEADLPHLWLNEGSDPSRSLLVMCPAEEDDRPTQRHFEPG